MKMMKCPQCEREIANHVEFCGYCGHRIQLEKTKKLKPLWVKIACGVAVVLALVLIGSLLFSMSKSKIEGGTEKEIECIMDIYSKDKDEIASSYKVDFHDEGYFSSEGTFCGMSGIYFVDMEEDNPEKVKDVVFFADEGLKDEDVILYGVRNVLGDYDDYNYDYYDDDKYWSSYTWDGHFEMMFYPETDQVTFLPDTPDRSW